MGEHTEKQPKQSPDEALGLHLGETLLTTMMPLPVDGEELPLANLEISLLAREDHERLPHLPVDPLTDKALDEICETLDAGGKVLGVLYGRAVVFQLLEPRQD